MEALHADWGRTGERAWDCGHALERGGAGARRSRPGRRRSWTPERPGWYRAALFNELYFLVDGGTFWEAGEVGGPEPEADDVGRFALIECIDYPFYDTVDVDFYASFAILETFPSSRRAGSATSSRWCRAATTRSSRSRPRA